jgi:hypothetical protein
MISRPDAGRLFFGDKVDIFKRPQIYTINTGNLFSHYPQKASGNPARVKVPRVLIKRKVVKNSEDALLYLII